MGKVGPNIVRDCFDFAPKIGKIKHIFERWRRSNTKIDNVTELLHKMGLVIGFGSHSEGAMCDYFDKTSIRRRRKIGSVISTEERRLFKIRQAVKKWLPSSKPCLVFEWIGMCLPSVLAGRRNCGLCFLDFDNQNPMASRSVV